MNPSLSSSNSTQRHSGVKTGLKGLGFGVIMTLGLMAVGCHKDGNPEVITESKLVQLLADLEVADAYCRRPMGETSYGRDSIGLAIMKDYGVTPEQVDSTLSWYGRNLDDYALLYRKVDSELDKRMKTAAHNNGVKVSEGDEIWPYSQFLTIRPSDRSQNFAFRMEASELPSGSSLEWKMRQSSGDGLELLLGVDYADGDSRFSTATSFGDRTTSLKFQTDSARTVANIFGIIRSTSTTLRNDLMVDSISLTVHPMDSTNYNRIKRQNSFRLNPKMRKPKAVISESVIDSIASSPNEGSLPAPGM